MVGSLWPLWPDGCRDSPCNRPSSEGLKHTDPPLPPVTVWSFTEHHSAKQQADFQVLFMMSWASAVSSSEYLDPLSSHCTLSCKDPLLLLLCFVFLSLISSHAADPLFSSTLFQSNVKLLVRSQSQPSSPALWIFKMKICSSLFG